MSTLGLGQVITEDKGKNNVRLYITDEHQKQEILMY